MGATIKWEGRELPMLLHQGTWRVRSRSKVFPVDIPTGTASLTEAKKIAREKLAHLPVKEKRSSGTLADVAALYMEAPKRCSQDSAKGNLSILGSVVKHAWGTDLVGASVVKLNELWPAYVAARQGLPRPDYSTRRDVNHAITSAIRQAASVFIGSLRPFYKSRGIVIPDDATNIIWPALGHRTPPEAKSDDLLTAWEALRESDFPMWVTVGLARFAGLRQSEILACRGKWVRTDGAITYIDLRDREEDGYFHKTGRWYSARVLSRPLAEYLLAVPDDSPVLVHPTVDHWIKYEPQKWLKKFTGKADKPLHRLRGLYADHVKQETEEAILARAAAIKEASRNLGHTGTAVTEGHYLTPDGRVS
ncbi:MAG: hypothetical protein V4726_24715 [Verrucomicrobiota bacterium]